ncbi:hypothetical protein ACOME3_002496 [Neoechinorhynchus agilis]
MSQNREQLFSLRGDPSAIRNVCILAHVDHGKTTLADSLLANNGIVSDSMAGRLKYMDTREDEQIRGITMKSSAVSLIHHHQDKHFMINLVDSPGHVDFSSEVSTAVRICDGAILVVDVVEGICAQTVAVVRQASQEKLKLILVLNKLDRLLTQLKMSPEQAFDHLNRLIESINSLVAQMSNKGFTDVEDEDVEYFNAVETNVIFASALGGWGFTIEHFIQLWSKKMGWSRDVLYKTIWGNYYLDQKTKTIKPKAKEKSKVPLSCSMIFSTIWIVLNAILEKNVALIVKICNQQGLRFDERLLQSKDIHMSTRHIMHQWLPIDRFVLDAIVTHLPSPLELSLDKIKQSLMSSVRSFDSLSQSSQQLSECFEKCDSNSSETIAFVSKFVTVDESQFERMEASFVSSAQSRQEYISKLREHPIISTYSDADLIEHRESKVVFMGFARLYSGKLDSGDTVNLIWPRHNPPSNQSYSIIKIDNLYLMMGRDYVPIKQALCGNVFAFTIDGDVIKAKSGVLSTNLNCPPFCVKTAPLAHSDDTAFAPLMQVALEPINPRDFAKLRRGVQLLNQSDPGVEIKLKSSGEIILCTWGEVHLQRCVKDLQDIFANVEFNVSQPLVAFKETLVNVTDRSQLTNIRKRVNCDIEKGRMFVVRAAPVPLKMR